jgi:hypothetical protein
MTLEAQIATVLRVAIALSLMLFLFWRFCRYRLEAFRQELFSIRNALFDDAYAGVISFNHPAYQMTRESINSLIRFAHRLNTIQLILLLIVYRRHPEINRYSNFDEELMKQCYHLPREARERILFARHQTQAIVLKYNIPLRLFMWIRHRWFGSHRGNKMNITNNTGVRLIEYEARLAKLETSEVY